MDCNIRTRQIDLSGLERVPPEREKSMVRDKVGDLDFLADGITPSNGSVTRVQRSIINAMAFIATESITREPVVPPARLSLLAIRAISTGLPRNIRTVERSSLEAVLGKLFLG